MRLVEIDADGVGHSPIPEDRGRREGRCVSHRRKRKLAEPRIAARLTDACETQRAGRSNGEVTVVLPRSPAFGFLRARADQILEL